MISITFVLLEDAILVGADEDGRHRKVAKCSLTAPSKILLSFGVKG